MERVLERMERRRHRALRSKYFRIENSKEKRAQAISAEKHKHDRRQHCIAPALSDV